MIPSRYRWVRFRTLAGVAVPLLVVALLSVVGYTLTTRAVNADRRTAAQRRAATDALQIRGLLEQAGTYAADLAEALAGERVPDRHRFEALVGSATSTV